MPPRKPLVPPEVASLLIVDAQLIQMEFVRDESPKLTRTQHDHHPLNRRIQAPPTSTPGVAIMVAMPHEYLL